MALFHFQSSVIQRSKGQSAVAAVAYQSGCRLTDLRTGVEHDYRRKRHVVFTEIAAPDHAPRWVQDRSQLWNSVEAAETRSNSQTAYAYEVALPRELTLTHWIGMVRKFIAPLVGRGQIVDWAIHDAGDGNPHAHLKATMRPLDGDHFGGKVREWNPEFAGKGKKYVADASSLVDLRHQWAGISNDALREAGFEYAATLSAESYAARGLDTIPGIHLGKARHIKLRNGEVPDRIQAAEAIEAQRELQRIANEERRIHRLIKSWEAELADARNALASLLNLEPQESDTTADDAASQTFAATPATHSRRIVLPEEFTLPHESPPTDDTPQIILPDGVRP